MGQHNRAHVGPKSRRSGAAVLQHLGVRVQATDLAHGKGKAGEAAAGMDSVTSSIAANVRGAGGAIADAAPVDSGRSGCVASLPVSKPLEVFLRCWPS